MSEKEKPAEYTALELLQQLRKENPGATGRQLIELAAANTAATTGIVPHLPPNMDRLPLEVQYEIYFSAVKRHKRLAMHEGLVDELEKNDIADRAIKLRDEYREQKAHAAALMTDNPDTALKEPALTETEWRTIRRLALAEWFVEREELFQKDRPVDLDERLQATERAILMAKMLPGYKTALLHYIDYDLDARIESLAVAKYAEIIRGKEDYPYKAKMPLYMTAVAEAVAKAFLVQIEEIKEPAARFTRAQNAVMQKGLGPECLAQIERLQTRFLGEEPDGAANESEPNEAAKN